MFLIRAKENRLAVCTSDPLKALTCFLTLDEQGHVPALEDFSGRHVTASDLEERIADQDDAMQGAHRRAENAQMSDRGARL